MNSMTPHEDDVLARALRGQVDGLTEAPFTVDDITGRAGRIRRNRRLAALAGGVAVAAMALPIGLMSGSVLDRSDAPPVATEAPAPTQAAGNLTLDLADLPLGEAPRLGYATLDYDQDGQARGGILHAPDGSTVDLPSLQLNGVVHQSDAWIVSMFDQAAEGNVLYSLDPVTGAHGEAQPISDAGLAASADGMLAAWIGPEGGVRVHRAGDDSAVVVGRIPNATRVLDVMGDDCEEEYLCRVVVAVGGKTPSALVLWSGGQFLRIRGPFAATTADLDHVGGVVSIDETEPSSCSEWRDLNTRDVLWSTCDHQLGPISPDTSQLIGLPSYADGFGAPMSLPILDAATGEPLRSWDLQTSTDKLAGITQFLWEDASHVLLGVYADGAWSVVRVGMDGTAEIALPPVKAPDWEPAYLLETR